MFIARERGALLCQALWGQGMGSHHLKRTLQRLQAMGGVSSKFLLCVVAQLSGRRCALGFESCAEP